MAPLIRGYPKGGEVGDLVIDLSTYLLHWVSRNIVAVVSARVRLKYNFQF